MKFATVLCLLASALLLPSLGHALDPPKAEPPSKPNPATSRELSWDDLLPAAERDAPLLSSQGSATVR
jgi:hypothetical protein